MLEYRFGFSVRRFRLRETFYLQTDTDWVCLNYLYMYLVGSPLLSQEHLCTHHSILHTPYYKVSQRISKGSQNNALLSSNITCAPICSFYVLTLKTPLFHCNDAVKGSTPLRVVVV